MSYRQGVQTVAKWSRVFFLGSEGSEMKGSEVKGAGWPTWLNGQTVAIIGTVFTVAIGIAAMNLVSMTSIRTEMGSLRTEMGSLRTELRTEMGSLRTEMNDMRKELTARLDALDTRLRGLEAIVLRIEHRVTDLEERVSVVEAHSSQSLKTAHLVQQPDR